MSSAGTHDETTNAYTPDSRFATGAWALAVGAGAVSILIGIAVLIWPEATVATIAVLFGLQLLVHGAVRIVQAITADGGGGARALYALLGVLSLAVGILVLRHLMQTVAVMALLFGLCWLVGGVIELVVILSDRRRDRTAGLILAVLSALVGVLVLAYPSISLHVLVWILGLWLVTWGAVTLFVTLMIRRMDRQATG